MYIKVHVQAGVKKESFVQKTEDTFDIAVREEAERNQANNRIRELLAHHFGVLPAQVRMVNGHNHPHKILAIDEAFITR